MRYAVWFLPLVLIAVISCKKQTGTGASFSEAAYTMQIQGRWSLPEFAVPPSAHFTTFVGMVHNAEASLWRTGRPASPGTELLAEIGNGTSLLTEIDSMTRAKMVSSLLLFTAPAPTGSKSISLYCNSNYPQVSFISMLGDTPDWFTGISGLSLYNRGTWVQDTSFHLYVYDAGTEEGQGFSSNNPASNPIQPVRVLTPAEAPFLYNGNSILSPVATVRFTRQ